MNSKLTSTRLVLTGGNNAIVESHFSTIVSLYEELQLCSVEAAFPQEHLYDFSSRSSYFGVISLQDTQDSRPEEGLMSQEDFNNTNGPAGVTFNNGTETHEDTQLGSVIGIVYLVFSQTPPYPLGSLGELSLGIIIAQEYRGKGYAKEALRLILDEAFQQLSCHRIQACLLDTYAKDRAMRLFMGMQFAHEGRRRRAFFSLIEQEWKDTTCLALLDTDWLIRSKYLTAAPPQTLWDELLSRHNRERGELLRWEEAQSSGSSWPTGMKRTLSMETVRVIEYFPDTNDTVGSASPHSSLEGLETRFSNKGKAKRKRDTSIANPLSSSGNPFLSDSSESDPEAFSKYPRFHSMSAQDDSDHDGPLRSFSRPSLSPSPSSPSPSFASSSRVSPSLSSVPIGRFRRSSFPDWENRSSADVDDFDGYASSTPSSQWDLVEPPSPTYSFPEMSDNPSESSEVDDHA